MKYFVKKENGELEERTAKVIYYRPHNYCAEITEWFLEGADEEEVKSICADINEYIGESPVAPFAEYKKVEGGYKIREYVPYDD